jgi:hypothetical protein
MLDIEKFLEKLPEADRLEFRAAWHSELAAHLDGDEKVKPKQPEHDPIFRAVLILETLLGELKEEKKKRPTVKADFKMWCSYIVNLGLRNLPVSDEEIQRSILQLEIQATEARLQELKSAAEKADGKSLVAQSRKMVNEYKANALAASENMSQQDTSENEPAQR